MPPLAAALDLAPAQVVGASVVNIATVLGISDASLVSELSMGRRLVLMGVPVLAEEIVGDVTTVLAERVAQPGAV